MPVTVGNGTATPVVGTETDVATIAPGISLDNLSVYVVGGTGGGNGLLEFALYATVGGFRTRVAQKLLRGTDTPTLIDWDTGIGPLAGGGDGSAQTEQIDAGGTNYTLTVIDRSTNFSSSPRNPVSATIAGVDSFDTAAGANFGQIFALTSGATGTLTLFPGYAQLMDVAIDQTNLPPVTVSVTADCGIGSVLGTVVKSVQMTGRDEDIASVFRGLKLPVATEYFVSVTNNSRDNIPVTLTGVTYSVSATAGGAVVLNGDVIGPSNNNIVIKWSQQPLNRVGVNSFAAPTDGAIPIYNGMLGTWFAITTFGDIQLQDTGHVLVIGWENILLDVPTMGAPVVNDVPIFNVDGTWHAGPIGGAITLLGDVIGPANANQVIKWDFVPLKLVGAGNFTTPADASIPVYNIGTNQWSALPFTQDVTVSDTNVVTVIGWDAVPLLTGVAAGSFDIGSLPDAGIPIFDSGTGHWRAFALSGDATMTDGGVVTVTGGAVTLTGNVVGPSGANRFLSLMLPANNASVVVPTPSGWTYVGFSNLAGPQSVTLPAAPTDGAVVVVTDEDGSLVAQTFSVIGAPHLVEGASPFLMNATYPGTKGSIALQFDASAPGGGQWFIFSDYSPNAASSISLAGNTNGPGGVNRFLAINIIAPDSNASIADIEGWYQVTFEGLTAPRTLTLPAAPTLGMVVVVTDGNGSLATQTFTIDGNGNNVEGAPTYVMTDVQNGPRGSVALIYQAFLGWVIWADNSPGATITLAGNVNGPSNANRWTSLVLSNTTGVPVTTIPFAGTVPGDGWWYVAVTGLTVNRTVNLPAAPTAGEVVVITDEGTGPNAFLAPGNTITVNGNGPLVEDVASFVMTNAYPGIFGSICLQFDGTNWYIFADYAPNAAGGVVALTGNVNGPSNANRFLSLIAGTAQNADITIPETEGYWYAGFAALTATRTCVLPAAPVAGEEVVVKDEDGSLAGGSDIIINGNGKNIDGAATVTMTNIDPGPFGSITVLYTGASWSIV